MKSLMIRAAVSMLPLSCLFAGAASADDFTWSILSDQSAVTTTITATTPIGTGSDSKVTNLSGTIGGSLRLPSYSLGNAIHLTTSDVSFTSNPNFTLSYGFFGSINIISNGLGFAIPGANNLGFAGPGPVAVGSIESQGQFTQDGNGAEGRGVLNYTASGALTSFVSNGSIQLRDVSPLALNLSGNLTQSVQLLTLTVPINFDETVEQNGIPVRTQIVGTVVAATTTRASGWKPDADGTWHTSGNWNQSGGIPGVAGSMFTTAVFGTPSSSLRTISVGGIVMPARIVLDASAGKTYRFVRTGNGMIQLGGAGGSIEVLSGSAEFSLPVVLNGSTATIRVGETVAANASARFTSLTTESATDLVKIGDSQMAVERMHVGDVAVQAGSIANVAGGTSISQVRSLTVFGTSWFDVTDGALIVDDGATPTVSLSDGVIADLRLAASADWALRGVTSSIAASGTSHALGYGTKQSTNLQSIDDVPLSDTAIVIRYTRFGDANLDLVVNFDDLLVLAQNYNSAGLWSDGDFTYDGVVGFDDLLKLAQNYSLSALDADQVAVVGETFAEDYALARSMVPEPASLVAFGLSLLTIRRQRI